jgi:hypothetical protein
LVTVGDGAFSGGLSGFPVDVLGLTGEGAGLADHERLVFNQKLLHDYLIIIMSKEID